MQKLKRHLKNLWLDRCGNLKDTILGLKILLSLEYLNFKHCKKMKFDNYTYDAILFL